MDPGIVLPAPRQLLDRRLPPRPAVIVGRCRSRLPRGSGVGWGVRDSRGPRRDIDSMKSAKIVVHFASTKKISDRCSDRAGRRVVGPGLHGCGLGDKRTPNLVEIAALVFGAACLVVLWSGRRPIWRSPDFAAALGGIFRAGPGDSNRSRLSAKSAAIARTCSDRLD